MKKINSTRAKTWTPYYFLNKTKFPIAKKLWKVCYTKQDLHAATVLGQTLWRRKKNHLLYDVHYRMQVGKKDVSKVTFISLLLVKFLFLFSILLPTKYMYRIQI